MTNDSTTLDAFEDLLGTLSDAIDDHLDGAVQDKGLADTCPHCVAKEMLEDNKTAFISDIFNAAKADPSLFSAAAVKALYSVTAMEYVLQQMIREFFNLFEDEMGEGEDAE